MRKYIFIISLFASQITLSQKIQNSHLKYDNDLKPYIETTIRNTEQKSITNIEFRVSYKKEYSSEWDVMAFEYKKKMVQIHVPAKSNKLISFYISDVENYKPSNVRLSRVRFSDGTVKVINNQNH